MKVKFKFRRYGSKDDFWESKPLSYYDFSSFIQTLLEKTEVNTIEVLVQEAKDEGQHVQKTDSKRKKTN